MDNENQQEVQPQEPHGDEPDYKALYEKTLAESRKWEERSKANKKQLDALAAKGGDEDVSERLTELSDKLRELEAERDKLQHQTDLRTWADEVAAETHVPASVLRGSTKEEMQQHAAALVAAGFSGKSVPDGGEPHGTPGITREQIEATKNAVDRVRLIAENLDLFK